MAISKVDFPTASTPEYTPDIETDYNAQNENIERVVRGYNGVSLTNWDTSTTAPQVASGSVIETNGVLYDVTGAETISTTGASSGTVYLVFDDSSGAEEFVWSSVAPTWSDTLNGWYVSGDRFTGHYCEWDGATSFSEKKQYLGNTAISDQAALTVDGFDIVGTDVWIGDNLVTQSVGAGTSWLIPAGAHMFISDSGLILEIAGVTGGGAWFSGSVGPHGFIVSDGTRYRVDNPTGGALNARYRKIW